jgi:hypothetical protein
MRRFTASVIYDCLDIRCVNSHRATLRFRSRRLDQRKWFTASVDFKIDFKAEMRKCIRDQADVTSQSLMRMN